MFTAVEAPAAKRKSLLHPRRKRQINDEQTAAAYAHAGKHCHGGACEDIKKYAAHPNAFTSIMMPEYAATAENIRRKSCA